jgi:circadian clock protein KaiB
MALHRTGRNPQVDSDPAVDYHLRLYIAGELPNSVRARENLRSICDRYLAGRNRCEVVDFLEEPSLAMGDGVVVTPTLVKLAPGPVTMVVGNLSDLGAVLHALGLPEDEGG